MKTTLKMWVIFTLFVSQGALATNSLRFFGNGTGDIDRVKIQIDNPSNSVPGPPADIGAEDFTLEFWMKAPVGENTATYTNSTCGDGWYSWIYGNTIFDRDRFNQGRNYGLSIVNGVLRFGLENGSSQYHTLCGSSNVTDGQWHHIAVQRRLSDGWLWLYVDGNLDAQVNGPNGDISYPDNGSPISSTYLFSDPYLVIGAEKHDAGAAYPSYSGFIDEVRLSNSLRYPTSSPYSFSVPTGPFTTDSSTMALYHMDEGSGTTVNDTSGASGGPSNGTMNVGGTPAGPVWSTDVPFSGGGGSPGTIQFTQNTVNVIESDTTRTFTVTRTGGTGAVSVNYVIGDTGTTATSGSDYEVTAQPASGTLSWADSDTSARSLTVSILGDPDPEPDEAIVLTLSSPTGGATLGGTSSATLTILDDDIPGTIQFTETAASIDESDTTRTFTVTRTGGTGAVSVNYVIGDTGTTATSGSDYEVTAQPASGTLSWADSDTSARSLTVNILGDPDPEPDEAIVLTLSSPTGGASLGANSSATLTILDNDAPGTLQFANSNQAVNEGAGTATIIINRTNGTSGIVTVAFMVSGGTATDSADYGIIQPMSGTLTFANGQTSATITVPIVDDGEEESTETINFTLNSPTGGASLGARDSMTLDITDNDSTQSLGSSGGAANPFFLVLALVLTAVGRRHYQPD